MRVRHSAVGLAVALLCTGGLAACGSSSSSSTGSSGSPASGTTTSATATNSANTGGNKSPIVLELMSIQVPGVTLLTDLATGANTAAKQINAAGGLGGRQVEIHTCNTMSNAAASTACAHKTLADHPVAEFGCETSWFSSGLPVYAAAKVPSFNCPNTPEDFHNAYSFGMMAGAVGDLRGLANWLCTQPSIKNVTMMLDDLPTFHVVPSAVSPILKSCGKNILSPVFYPLASVDLTPYVNRVVQSKPDFVFLLAIGPQVVQIFKGFQTQGFPASKVGGPDTDFTYSTIVKPAGSAMDGAYSANQFVSWGDTADSDVASYTAAIKKTGQDPTNASIEWGYAMVEWFATVAKATGYANFDSASLTKFMSTQTNVHIPLSRTLINPGPAQYPQQKQPYIQITQWKNGKMNPVSTKAGNGWVSGF